MRLRSLALLSAAVLLAAPAHAQAPVCAPSVGNLALVLPGGGAKGFARLGVLRMLDSLGVVPDVVVGTSAVSGLRDTSRLDVSEDDPLSIAGQLLAFVFEQPLPPLQPGDVWLSSDVSGVDQLDFSIANIDRVIVAGYRAATALGEAPCLPRGRVRPRGTVPPLTAFLMPGSVHAELANILWLALGDFGGRIPDLPQFQARLRSLAPVDRFQSIWLHPQRVAGDSVQLAAQAQASSAAQLLAGAAFDRELGPRLWVGRVQSLAGQNTEVTGVLALGQLQQELQVTLRRSYDVMRSKWSPLIGGALTRMQVRDIRDGREFPVIQTADWLAEAGIERRLTRRSTGALTIFARQWDEPVFSGSPTALGARTPLRVAHPVYGPLNLQGMVAGGVLQQRTYGVFCDASGYFGVRGGVGVTTALGPLALEYGVNDRARGTMYLRFGDWF